MFEDKQLESRQGKGGKRTLLASLVARGSVDIRPLNKISEFLAPVSRWVVKSCPLIFGVLRDDKAEENIDSVDGMGKADTSEIIKVKSSAKRPAREYCMIVGPADVKMKRKRTRCYIDSWLSEEGCALADSDSRLTGVTVLQCSFMYVSGSSVELNNN